MIRKQLVGAWDLAFAWQADEPGEHHPALPLSILLAMLVWLYCGDGHLRPQSLACHGVAFFELAKPFFRSAAI